MSRYIKIRSGMYTPNTVQVKHVTPVYIKKVKTSKDGNQKSN